MQHVINSIIALRLIGQALQAGLFCLL